jgi:hypothetical protein
MNLLFLNLIKVLALQVREIIRDLICDLNEGHSLRIGQQYFSPPKEKTALHFLLSYRTRQQKDGNSLCMYASSVPKILPKFIRLVFWIILVKYYQSERKINASYLIGIVTRIKG